MKPGILRIIVVAVLVATTTGSASHSWSPASWRPVLEESYVIQGRFMAGTDPGLYVERDFVDNVVPVHPGATSFRARLTWATTVGSTDLDLVVASPQARVRCGGPCGRLSTLDPAIEGLFADLDGSPGLPDSEALVQVQGPKMGALNCPEVCPWQVATLIDGAGAEVDFTLEIRVTYGNRA